MTFFQLRKAGFNAKILVSTLPLHGKVHVEIGQLESVLHVAVLLSLMSLGGTKQVILLLHGIRKYCWTEKLCKV